MIDLIATNNQLEAVTTGGTVALDVITSFVCRVFSNGYTYLGRQATAIAAAGTDVIVSPPSATTERGVRGVIIRNKHATQATPVTVQTNIGGIITPLWIGTLNAGEILQYDNEKGAFCRLVPVVHADVQSFTAGGAYSWIKPTTFVPSTVIVVLYGAGGGGSAGNSVDTAVAGDGGGGGGGGAYVIRTYRARDLPDNVPVIVGFGGVGGTGALNSQGTNGSVGGQSSFGRGKAKVFAGGGGSGPAGGENSDIAGGGGGGTGGSAAVSSGASGLPGLQTSLLDRKAGQGARSTIANTTWYAESGGGGGGPIPSGAPVNVWLGGTSIFGGGGGGAGATSDVGAGTITAASAGGASNACTVLGGGGAAGGASGAVPTNGSNGTDGHAGRGGTGGGGGGGSSTASVNGAAGGKGGACGGGGGGGGTCRNTGIGGNGGNGGDGGVFVFCY